MPHSIFERVKRWTMEGDESAYRFYEILDQIEYHAGKRFYEYHPTVGPHPEFLLRLRDWLNRLPNESDQKTLFEFVPHLFFPGSADFNALYRSAFRGSITRWMVDQLHLSLLDQDLNNLLAAGVNRTWFCPITDSMQIAAFYHVNNLNGWDERPDWKSLSVFGNEGKIEEFIARCQIERIVLLEDFIGCGSQMGRAVEFAASLKSRTPILLVPLIICPVGARVGREMQARYSHVTFSPVLELDETSFISEVRMAGENALFSAVRDLAVQMYARVSGGESDTSVKPYGPFGFAKTGATTIMYTNCPDNTLPLIHHASRTWSPLFPRSARI